MTSTTNTPDATAHSVAHASFTVTRDIPVPPARVFAAFADPAQKAAWFGDPENFATDERSFDFRAGGREVEDGQWHGGPRSRFEATYTDIVENERIVYTYDMWIDGQHISTSLAALEFEAIDGGTRYTQTEHGAHLDGFDDGAMREQGTRQIVETLAAYLTAQDAR